MATAAIYTLSLHDALPIYGILARPAEMGSAPGRGTRATRRAARRLDHRRRDRRAHAGLGRRDRAARRLPRADRKSTRLNSSHLGISYAVFCLKKKTKTRHN